MIFSPPQIDMASHLMTLQELARAEGLVTMPKTEYVKEHRKLIRILRKGNSNELQQEANEQEAELKGNLQGGMAPFLCRVGSKKRFAELLDFIAPPHTTYVEPFVGSGAFYWYKEPAPREIINDLDKDVARTFQMIKKAPTNLALYPKNLETKEQLAKWFLAHQNSRSIATQLVYQIIHHCGGWMGKQVNEKTGNVKRDLNPYNKLKHIAEYKARMAHTTVKSEDYAKLVKTYDGKDTFIFLDPPYENSSGLGYAKGSAQFDFERLRDTLAKVKGHWLMTINDSPLIRQLFKSYTIHPIVIKGHKAKRVGEEPGRKHIGSTDRPELLISNYTLPRDWKSHVGKSIKGGGKDPEKLKILQEAVRARDRLSYENPSDYKDWDEALKVEEKRRMDVLKKAWDDYMNSETEPPRAEAEAGEAAEAEEEERQMEVRQVVDIMAGIWAEGKKQQVEKWSGATSWVKNMNGFLGQVPQYIFDAEPMLVEARAESGGKPVLARRWFSANMDALKEKYGVTGEVEGRGLGLGGTRGTRGTFFRVPAIR